MSKALVPALFWATSMAAQDLTGVVFDDRNRDGIRGAGEPGMRGVVVSDQVQVVQTDSTGTFRIVNSTGFGVVFATTPNGFRATRSTWLPASTPDLAFGFVRQTEPAEFTFVHASDTHIATASLERTTRLRALVDSLSPAFLLITGDLVRDALRVSEGEASGYYELFQREIGRFSVPVWTVPGNHEVFGIERHQSLVSPRHPLYGRGMYRKYRGPDYYSFNAGGIHFVGLNSIDIDDLWYYGHIDSTQVRWLERDLAHVPPTTPVVTFNHIPFFSAMESVRGYEDGPPAPSLIEIRGKAQYRHAVSNAAEILALLKGRPFPLALGGHLHVRERLRYEGVETRFDQAAAVVAPNGAAGLIFPSGVTVYRVASGKIGEGLFVPLTK